MVDKLPVVDSFRFLSRATCRVARSWIKREPERSIPWSPLEKPITESTVAMISSAGVALKTDRPFDQEGERANPFWGDPSFRIIPQQVTEEDVSIYHMHIDPTFAERDLNCIFPLEILLEMEEKGEIGRTAANHYSIMGYILQTDQLLQETTPQIIYHLQNEEVDVVLLVPV